MTDHDGPWTQGTPSWTDLQVDDLTSARTFYTELLGWDIQDGPTNAGGYLMALLHGRPVAGIGPKMSTEPTPNVWTTYLAADDVDDVAQRISAAGGTVFMAPFDVMDFGRMTVAADTTGSVFGVWQGKKQQGAAIVNEPGALCWNEVHTSNYDESKRFYTDVFQYKFTDVGDDDFTYAVAAIGDDTNQVAGFLDNSQVPASTGCWLTWFAVADLDDSVDKVVRLGGAVLAEPSDSPFGRMRVVQGAQGETFGVIELPNANS